MGFCDCLLLNNNFLFYLVWIFRFWDFLFLAAVSFQWSIQVNCFDSEFFVAVFCCSTRFVWISWFNRNGILLFVHVQSQTVQMKSEQTTTTTTTMHSSRKEKAITMPIRNCIHASFKQETLITACKEVHITHALCNWMLIKFNSISIEWQKKIHNYNFFASRFDENGLNLITYIPLARACVAVDSSFDFIIMFN